jgi:predicted AlkP superfamily phosphohydrolase/phosphomutase
MVIHERPISREQDDRSIFERLIKRVGKKAALCQHLLEDGDFDLICIVFGETHTGAHQLWKYGCDAQGARVTSPPADLAEGIRRLYRATDEAMSGILRQIGDNANTFVISSVGMKRQYPAAGLGEALTRQLGYQAAPRSSVQRALNPMAVLRRALPREVRNQLSRLLPQAIQERWVSDKFEFGTDWDRTSAFCIPSWYTSFFRVNLRGREPRGIVAPGGEYERVLDRLEHDLRLLIDPVTGKPAIEYLARATDLFGGGPPETLPDLFAEWAEADHFMERVTHPSADLHQVPCEFHRDSDHSRRAFVAAAGPLIGGRGDLGELSPLDLAPTFRRLLEAEALGRPHAGILGS